MKIEERADGLHITGYVNVTGKKSRPIITPHGKCIEVIEERAFESAISKGGDISVTVDHDQSRVYASTSNGTLKLEEDAIGLKASVLIQDQSIIEVAKKGKIKGWSFGMFNVVDDLEQRAEGELPIRHVKDFTLDHITLVVNKTPCYAATSVEYRADSETEIETRSFDSGVEIAIEKQKFDYSKYKNRIEKLIEKEKDYEQN